MTRKPRLVSSSTFCKVSFPTFMIAKKMLILLLRNLSILLFSSLFLGVLFFAPKLQARPSIGVLSVDVQYPSTGLKWLGLFLQEELSLQLQLTEQFSVISPDTMRRWDIRFRNSSQPDSSINELKKSEIFQLKPKRLLKLSIQKVLNKLSVTWSFVNFGENGSQDKIKKIHSWLTPDKLVAALLKDIKEHDKIFSKLTHFPQGYTWDGVKDTYQWRLKEVFATNSIAWENHKNELDALLLSYPSHASSIKFYRAILLIIESSIMRPAHVPSLNSAETDILSAMKIQPGKVEHHTLLSLLHYLRKEPLFAKQQANIANKINPGNGLSLILYGLTIGKNPQAGATYIERGIRLYPFVGEPSPDTWQPYHVLVNDLKPWLIFSDSKKAPKYEQLMSAGKEHQDAKRWTEARQAFEDASALEPRLPEPFLHLAQLRLAQHDTESALLMLAKLSKKYPKHADINLYLGYAHEKSKHYEKAEYFYREVLQLKPEHHKSLLRLGAVLIKRGKLTEARSFLQSLTQKYPMYTVAWWNLGIVYYQLGEMELAESVWEESLRLEPDNNLVRVRLEQLREELF